ncbi:cupin domain-containing protein [Parasedimentitalea huanghaiensis]|uniref:Cupin domain-containing protein n=1 Tax=Parasedimentitalea huanghaiensis TaxID=2682100 RepID=A0A6L6WJ43_9RHOB|nr:cupin domain-containing protein [Zongyanglinia huanghaiensis]MVO17510.1 cupin domain-containing protein [Zongyanglinia huanghaiensis]
MTDTIAEVLVPTDELRNDIPFYTKVLGMRMDSIYPADNPSVAVFSGHGVRLRIEKGADVAPGTLRILTEDPDGFAEGQRRLIAPNGTQIEIEERHPPMVMPETVHSFVVRRLKDQAPWVIGRAGMHYRDLVPDRLGGSIIASHIRIPDGGPVPDMVHFHRVGFQLIFCIHGWVDVVYEDQGPKMRLTAGDCFIQPPEIRHRVLEASDNVQVIEIGVPAEHVTEIDHEMTLPTEQLRPEREWQGQRFVYNKAEGADWVPFRLPGFVCRDTSISENTKGVAGVQVVRRGKGTPQWATHDTDIHFTFVMDGTVTLEGEGREPYQLEQGDAFVIPPGMKTRLTDASDDIELMEVTLPGVFNTTLS